MSSSTSSSDPWRRFGGLLLTTAAVGDPVHYRIPIAERLVAGLAKGESPDAGVLVPRSKLAATAP